MPSVDVTSLLLAAALGVALVVLLITWVRIPAFIALAAGLFFVGLGALGEKRLDWAMLGSGFLIGLPGLARVILLGLLVA